MRGEEGFTLVEVLVALVVTAIMLAVLMSAATTARMRMKDVEERREAALLAVALLDRASIEGTDKPAISAGRSGELRWSMERVQIATEPRHQVGLFAWRATVMAPDGRRLISLPTRRLVGAIPHGT